VIGSEVPNLLEKGAASTLSYIAHFRGNGPVLQFQLGQVLVCRFEQEPERRSNLTLLSLMEPVQGMPDPGPHRGRIQRLLQRLESTEKA
jgi:hypothetical protein